MDFHLNIEEISVNITDYITKYRGKAIEDLFPNYNILRNEMGQFMEVKNVLDVSQNDLCLHFTKKKLLQNLKTVYYIGEAIERDLFRRGVKTLLDLRFNLRYRNSANEILELIKKKDHVTLSKNRYIQDLDLIFCFNKKELLFIDIETLDLYDSSIIILGLGYYDNEKFVISQLFSRELEEEIAILEYFRKEILPRFKGFITYNGKSFDIPYIANRLLYFFDENPMILESEDPYEKSNTQYYHLDLYHNCRRKFKGKYENYSLTSIETQLLNFKRQNELPSSMVGLCYRKYKENPNRYIGLIKKCIEHNYHDIYSMLLILKKLIQD